MNFWGRSNFFVKLVDQRGKTGRKLMFFWPKKEVFINLLLVGFLLCVEMQGDRLFQGGSGGPIGVSSEVPKLASVSSPKIGV